jgi:hypothetical protein
MPVRLEPNRSFAPGLRSTTAEYPILKVKQTYAGPTVE